MCVTVGGLGRVRDVCVVVLLRMRRECNSHVRVFGVSLNGGSGTNKRGFFLAVERLTRR